MLELLRIRNLALIEDVEMDFSSGLNVITGESGAGKSFILRALDCILGDKISPSMIRAGCDKAQVEALFILNGEEVILRRELLAETGRSRMYINDALGSQEKAQSLGSRLLIHTSQHGQQKLLRPAFHVHMVDAFLDDPTLLARQRDLLGEITTILKQEEEVRAQVKALEDKRDFLEYQQGEIQKVTPNPGEEAALMEEKKRIQAQTDARETIRHALEVINGQEGALLEGLGLLQSCVQSLAAQNDRYDPFVALMEEARQTVVDLDRELRGEPLDFAHQDRLEAIESRLWALSQLQRRLKRSLDQILELEQEIEANIAFLDQSQLRLTQLERKRQELAAELASLTQAVNASRHKASQHLHKQLESRLKHLGFSDKLKIVFENEPREIYPDILEDRPHIFWVPNPGQPPQPLDKIASGGELSRFLLAVVGLQAQKELPTLLFDEVDSGIGGMTLNKVAASIQELAKRQQVILITHWPQLAALGQRHFHVSKEIRKGTTFTLCTRLEGEDIVEELTRMAGGGDKGRIMANELLGEHHD